MYIGVLMGKTFINGELSKPCLITGVYTIFLAACRVRLRQRFRKRLSREEWLPVSWTRNRLSRRLPLPVYSGISKCGLMLVEQ